MIAFSVADEVQGIDHFNESIVAHTGFSDAYPCNHRLRWSLQFFVEHDRRRNEDQPTHRYEE